jgi:hypothetical protein
MGYRIAPSAYPAHDLVKSSLLRRLLEIAEAETLFSFFAIRVI